MNRLHAIILFTSLGVMTATTGCNKTGDEHKTAGAVDGSSAPSAPADKAPLTDTTGPTNPFGTTESGAPTESAGAEPSIHQHSDAADGESAGSEEMTEPYAASEAQGATENEMPAIAVTGNANLLTFEPRGEVPIQYDNVALRVAGGDGIEISQKFGSGEPVSLSHNLPDGVYTWEAVTAPTIDPYVRQQMAAVRESGDIKAERALIKKLRREGYLPTEQQANANRQAGHFRIQNGELVRGDITE